MSGEEEHDKPGYELCMKPHYAWIQNFFRAVPLARGFEKREKMREVDVKIRKYVSDKLMEAANRLQTVQGTLAQAALNLMMGGPYGGGLMGMQPGIPGTGSPGTQPQQAQQQAAVIQNLGQLLEQAMYKARNLALDIEYAGSGWAPVGAAQAIREDEILKLCEYDDTMIGLAENALAKAREASSKIMVNDMQGSINALQEFSQILDSLRNLYDERRKYIEFATTGKTVAGQVREAAGKAGEALKGFAHTALEKARSLLSRLRGVEDK